ncbi:hypothetical protein ACFWPU_01530 [Streptomyces sp. NPDC058471]|uniref:hypothetical protein n=1 Tax=Streptomyces sp. NPDC058471 TaxID=3346516 RepID=UPI003663EDB1
MSPRDHAMTVDKPTTTGDEVLVDCRDAALIFGRGARAVVAVHGANLRVRSADRLAIVGPSGSGKSSHEPESGA